MRQRGVAHRLNSWAHEATGYVYVASFGADIVRVPRPLSRYNEGSRVYGRLETEGAGIDTSKDKRSKAIAWVLVVAWAAFIFFASAKTGADMKSGLGILSAASRWLSENLSAWLGYKVDASPIGHFAEYLVFGGLLANAFRFHATPTKAAGLAVAVASVYAVTDEWHQLFVPGRSCDPMDWLVDFCAAALGAVLVASVVTQLERGRITARFVNGLVSGFIVVFFIVHGLLGSALMTLAFSGGHAWLVWGGVAFVAVHVVLSMVTSFQQLSDAERPPSARKKRHLALKWATGLLLGLAVIVHVLGVPEPIGTLVPAHAARAATLVVLAVVMAIHMCVGAKSLLKDIGVDRRYMTAYRVIVCVAAALFCCAALFSA